MQMQQGSLGHPMTCVATGVCQRLTSFLADFKTSTHGRPSSSSKPLKETTPIVAAATMDSIIRRRATSYVCQSCTRRSLRVSRPRRSYATTTTPKPDIYDVVCVGGGPAGLSLLTALRRFLVAPDDCNPLY